MFSHLFARLSAGIFIVIVLVFSVLGYFLIEHVTDRERQHLNDQLESLAWVTADAVNSASIQTDSPEMNQLATRLGEHANARVTIISPDGTVIGDSESDPATLDNHATRPEFAAALTGEVGEAERWSATLNRRLLYKAVPIEQDGQIIGAARVALPMGEVRDLLGEVIPGIITALAISGLAVALITTIISKVMTQPLSHLTAVTRRVTHGDLSARAEVENAAEFAELADAFNEMAYQLELTMDAMEIERSRLEMVVEHLSDGILIVEPDGSIGLINRAAEQFLQVRRERVADHSYGEVFRDYDLIEMVRLAQANDNTPDLARSRFIELGRPRRTIQAFAYRIPAGKVPLVVVILRDITELRRTEAVRRDFVANVSHDLRTPISSLKALTETLLNGALEDEEVARDFLGRMEVEVDNLAHLVQELLELSRAESGQLVLHAYPGNIAHLIRRTVSRLQAQAAMKDVNLQLELPDNLPECVFDSDRIEQVLMNLLQNAVRFTPAGGAVIAGARLDGDQIVVFVRDSGPGLESNELERVFERFYKVDRSRSATGSGLGLAIAKHLVQLHGGQIWVESVYGSGATFKFTLPVASNDLDLNEIGEMGAEVSHHRET